MGIWLLHIAHAADHYDIAVDTHGSFLQAGLLDEVSLMIGEGIDGRAGMAVVFDGIKATDYPPTLLTLNTVERLGNTVWLRYTVDK